jgi:signal transduction histidine kinase
MKRKIFLLIFIFSFSKVVFSQVEYYQLPNLRLELINASEDTSKCRILRTIALAYRHSNFDSSIFYADSLVRLANKIGNETVKANALSMKGYTLLFSGRLPESLKSQYEALKISEKIKDTNNIALALNRIGNVYMELGDYNKAYDYYLHSKDLYKAIRNIGRYNNALSNIANVYNLMNKPDSALYNLNLFYQAASKSDDRLDFVWPEMQFRIGNAYKLKGDTAKAIASYKQGIIEANTDHDLRNLSMNNLMLAKIYNEYNQFDSSIKFAGIAYQVAKKVGFLNGVQESAFLISELYNQTKKYDSAFKYLEISNVAKDSITGKKRLNELQQTILNELEQNRNNENLTIKKENRQKQLALIGGLIIALCIAAFLFKNNKMKQKINAKLEITLSNLQATQSQLIQSEKMASLGQLTAGIAHEIQNPLNFVNNFSEVSTELVDEMKSEIKKGNYDEVNVIADDVKQNLEKINHHGQRASDIVKGMLQHSRSSSGVNEPTDINALTDEYFRLAYHGLRAKDKTFNATMKTDFDESIGNISIIPQDIGRVVLNLITNAFYAVNEKSKQSIAEYEPTVSVVTKKVNHQVEIRVTDNGDGIPANIVDKIFQPFFTTKPTGQGTGLGLSLSYDIVKAHGGELKVETKEGMGTEFIIQLPIV